MNAPACPRSPMTEALREIQAPVRERLEAVAEEMRRIVVSDLPLIESVSEHLLKMRGKMFRPTLTLLASAVDGRPERRAVTLAAVIEMIHLATLVHDDSVDHSVMRRGLPTVNSMFSHQVSVIMGDFLYARALVALVEVGEMEFLHLLSRITTELTIGEMRQLGAVDALGFTEEDYEALIRAKTAVLLRGACELGAMCGASRHRASLARFGDRLGMAFQVADDILDYVEDSAMTGKPSGLDLKEHKVTLPLIGALRTASPRARARIDALFAEPAPGDDLVAEVVGIVIEAGGIEFARERGEQFARQAAEALTGLPDNPAVGALRDSITYVMDRRS